MDEEKLDVFARALLYIYQARLENMGLKADFKVVRKKKPEAREMEVAG